MALNLEEHNTTAQTDFVWDLRHLCASVPLGSDVIQRKVLETQS